MLHPQLRVLDATHRIVTRQLAIKANPPTYRRVVTTIQGVLSDAFAANVRAPISAAVGEMAAAADIGNARDRAKKTRSILNSLAAKVGAEGISDKQAAKIGQALGAAYALGQDETASQLGFEMDFALADQDAIAGLHDSGLFWIGQHYDQWVGDSLRAKVGDILVTQGLGRVEAGAALEALFAGQITRSESYWRGLAATTATRARSFGALSGMTETGAVSYEYVNPDDERTSQVCRTLNGTIFTIKGSNAIKNNLLAAKNPEDVKAITPWPRVQDVQLADGQAKSGAELQAQGVAWPPLHFHCRSSIDVASWGPLPAAPDPVGNVATDLRDVGPATLRPDPWLAAKLELDTAEAAAQNRGLPLDKWSITQDVAVMVDESIGGSQFGHPRGASMRAGGPRKELVGNLEFMRSQAKRVSLTAAKRASMTAAADAVEAQITLLDNVTKAYRKAERVAPQAWLDVEREFLIEEFTSISAADLKKNEITRKDMEAAINTALDSFTVADIRLLANNGDRLRLDLQFGGSGGYADSSWRGNAWTKDASPEIISHEVYHRLDLYHGGLSNGEQWEGSPGYEAEPAAWRKTWEGPFNAAKQVGADGSTSVTTTGHGLDNYKMHRGNWVDSYEGRIYGDEKTSGPIEFVAQAASYRTKERLNWADSAVFKRKMVVKLNHAKELHVGGFTGSILKETTFRTSGTGVSLSERARGLYGPNYTQGIEKMHGDGLRLAKKMIRDHGDLYEGDADLVASAAILSHRFGVALPDLLGPGGAFAGELTRPMTPTEIAKIELPKPGEANSLAYVRILKRGGLTKVEPRSVHEMAQDEKDAEDAADKLEKMGLPAETRAANEWASDLFGGE